MVVVTVPNTWFYAGRRSAVVSGKAVLMIATAVTGDVRERSAVRWGSDGGAGRWSHPWDRSRDIATRGACWSGFQGRSCQAAPQLVVLPQGRGPASAVGLRLASSSPRLVGLGGGTATGRHTAAQQCVVLFCGSA
ncbi:hypothetical protein B296_00025233 [Ensete ventricosum]|uniref:Uncharacterized protein n=1 Tax=Ensete ventricosum TaxID=4639 RepID=A0A426ZJV7_ENSVE|nr:hypothetical protein B296_00025233 [Ensete ventricosum]